MDKINVKQFKGSDVYIDETEIKPNIYACNVLIAIAFIMLVVCMLNEVGVFEISRDFVRLSFFITVFLCVVTALIVKNKVLVKKQGSKYIIMSIILFLVLTMTVILNINAVLGYALPLLLATQYRSMKISRIALFGSCLCCLISPILSYLWGTWSLNFMKGYIEIFCDVTIDTAEGNNIGMWQAISQILLYWSMPQTMTICAFGFILYSSTRNGIKSVDNQIKVIKLSDDLSRQMESITTMQEKILFAMSDIIESRDLETGGHVRRTSEVTCFLMKAMKQDPNSGVSEEFCNGVINSAPMHDLGKIAIPDTILKKKGKLTTAEFEIVKTHPIKSAQIIQQALTGVEDEKLLEIAINTAKYHHERYDGMGYPEQLKGKEIPLEARIMAIVDVYDALVSPRYYKAPVPFEEAFAIIQQSMGTQFDPDLNKYFVACREEIENFYCGDEDLKNQKAKDIFSNAN